MGQLGLGDAINRNQPTEVVALRTQKIVYIAAGHSHTLCINGDGEIYGFGSNANLQLGQGSANYLTPTKLGGIPNEPYLAVAGGNQHSILLTSMGPLKDLSLIIIGNGEMVHLGRDTEPYHVKLATSEKIKIIKAGETHSIGISGIFQPSQRLY